MSILHHRRNVKRRYLAREAEGRASAPHMYERASVRAQAGESPAAVEDPPQPQPARRAAPRKRRKAAKRRKAPAA